MTTANAQLKTVHWRKAWRKMLNCRALRRAPEAHRWLWVTALLLAEDYDGHLTEDGLSLAPEDLSDAGALDLEDTRSGLDYFISCGMIELEGNTYRVVNFRHYQVSPEAERMRRYRQKQKAENRRTDGQKTEDIVNSNNGCDSDVTRYGSNNADPNSDPEFMVVWSAYPKKEAQLDAFAAWQETATVRPSTDDLVENITARTATPDWQKDAHRWVPQLGRFLREHRWTDVPPGANTPDRVDPRDQEWGYSQSDIEEHGTDPLWTTYTDNESDRCGWCSEEGPWMTFTEFKQAYREMS